MRLCCLLPSSPLCEPLTLSLFPATHSHTFFTTQWDPEVRDRALGLVEDFGRGLPLPAYREAYEGLLVRRQAAPGV